MGPRATPAAQPCPGVWPADLLSFSFFIIIFFKHLKTFIKKQFTCHTILPCEVYDSVACSIFRAVLPPRSILEHDHRSTKTSRPLELLSCQLRP